MTKPPIIIIETSGFEKRFDRLATDAERSALYRDLAANLKAGNVIRGSGGIRKIASGTAGNG